MLAQLQICVDIYTYNYRNEAQIAHVVLSFLFPAVFVLLPFPLAQGVRIGLAIDSMGPWWIVREMGEFGIEDLIWECS